MATLLGYLEARLERHNAGLPAAELVGIVMTAYQRGQIDETKNIINALKTCKFDDYKPLPTLGIPQSGACPKCGADIANWESPGAFNEKHDCEVG